jgi:membrane-associated protein
VRTFAPIVAGVGKMKYRDFVLFNIIGALLWAVGIAYAGYYIGAGLESIGIHIDTILLPIIAFIVFVSILPPLVHILKDAQRRQIMWDGTKRQLRLLFRKRL